MRSIYARAALTRTSVARSSCLGLALFLAIPLIGALQQKPQPAQEDTLKKHYDTAQRVQAAGNLAQAKLEYQAFLADALHRLADHRANTGDLDRALFLFEQASLFAPEDTALRLDFAEACRVASQFPKGKSVAESVLHTEPRNPRARFVLGKILLQMGAPEDAKRQLEAAVHLEPTFEHGYQLAIAYLRLKDPEGAEKVFAEMRAGFGDRAEIHMEFGRAFAQAGYPERGIPEFQKAISRNGSLRGAHYSLGAAYLLGLGDGAFAQASEEFRNELSYHPDDYLSLCQLGYIALSQHRLDEAENDFRKATVQDPTNPDLPLSLGQLYVQQGRTAEAEAALRKSIELTTDISRNHYQIQRAHYLLGKLLLQRGLMQEAKQELKTAEQLLKKTVASNQGETAGGLLNDVAKKTLFNGPKASLLLNPETLKQVEAFEKRVSPAVADSYNNLGTIAAGYGELASAANNFEQAAAWNPQSEEINYNWGRAAYTLRDYKKGVDPLTRHLREHPDDVWTRAALGSSLFGIQRYQEALAVLQPIEREINSVAQLNYVYAVCLVKSGDTVEGIRRLQVLEQGSPNSTGIHAALGEAFAKAGEHLRAVEQFRRALKLNPKDDNAKYRLARSMLELKQTDEARTLLAELVRQGSPTSGAYVELGKLQLESGDIKAAVTTLEMGAKLDPENGIVHRALAEAYGKDSRAEDAAREMKLYESVQSEHPQNPD